MTRDGLTAYAGKRVLLLQGPLGPFFARLAADFTAAGATVFKINFNGGDWLFYRSGATSFRGSIDEWPTFLEDFIRDNAIDVVVLFGDCRPLHRIAAEVADRLGTRFGVFEEGYVRPDYVTFERFGVNGRSRIPRSAVFYRNIEIDPAPRAMAVGNTFWHAAGWAVLYYAAAILTRAFLFPRYRHHRPLCAIEGLPWIRSAFRKVAYAYRERGVLSALTGRYAKQYFLVALQVETDSQIRVHSNFGCVRDFIEHVLTSFAAHAPADTLLVIKHHPLDRGYHDYASVIEALAEEHGVARRVHYIHDQHLPTLLDHARGAVVINSTVGLSAIHHGVPVKTCGTAVYDVPGLTFAGTLDDFWAAAADVRIDGDLYERFRAYVIGRTQLNGSFYRRLDVPWSAAGLVWPKHRGRRPALPARAGDASAVQPDMALPVHYPPQPVWRRWNEQTQQTRAGAVGP